jgi:putative oxidoreductase
MLNRLTHTTNDPVAALARVALGAVMLPHAAQKLFGWFGGYGIAGTMGYFTGTLGLPAALGYLVIAAEALGALLLVAGLLGRVGALAIVAVMIGAVAVVHLPAGFFMNWGGQLAGEGFEYHILAVALAAVVAIRGSGALSLDLLLVRRAAPAARRRAA